MDFYWQLAQILFWEHATYGEAFQVVEEYTNTKEKSKLCIIWVNKIKNRLERSVSSTQRIRGGLIIIANRMEKICKGYKDLMGSTGEGIKNVDEIDMEKYKEFVNKWCM